MKKISMVLLISLFISGAAIAGEWEDLINDSLGQAPSARKRKTGSGRRLLREKVRRMAEIDARVPVLVKRGEYPRAESLLKEALKLTIETYGLKNMRVVDRFASLGIVYMEAGDPAEAEEVFTWALNIGEEIAGEGHVQLANVYRFLSVAYYQQGKYDQAEDKAGTLLSITVGETGPDSPQSREARDLLRQIRQR